jgi:hypothetical protein
MQEEETNETMEQPETQTNDLVFAATTKDGWLVFYTDDMTHNDPYLMGYWYALREWLPGEHHKVDVEWMQGYEDGEADLEQMGENERWARANAIVKEIEDKRKGK